MSGDPDSAIGPAVFFGVAFTGAGIAALIAAPETFTPAGRVGCYLLAIGLLAVGAALLLGAFLVRRNEVMTRRH